MSNIGRKIKIINVFNSPVDFDDTNGYVNQIGTIIEEAEYTIKAIFPDGAIKRISLPGHTGEAEWVDEEEEVEVEQESYAPKRRTRSRVIPTTPTLDVSTPVVSTGKYEILFKKNNVDRSDWEVGMKVRIVITGVESISYEVNYNESVDQYIKQDPLRIYTIGSLDFTNRLRGVATLLEEDGKPLVTRDHSLVVRIRLKRLAVVENVEVGQRLTSKTYFPIGSHVTIVASMGELESYGCFDNQAAKKYLLDNRNKVFRVTADADDSDGWTNTLVPKESESDTFSYPFDGKWFLSSHLFPVSKEEEYKIIKEKRERLQKEIDAAKIPFILPIPDGFKGEVLKQILFNPSGLNAYAIGCKNRQYFDKILSSFVPYKVGVENEVYSSCPTIANNCHFGTPTPAFLKKMGLDSIEYDSDPEIRIRFLGWRQLLGVKRFYDLMTKEVTLDTRGGIHYHIDCPEVKEDAKTARRVREWWEANLERIQPIFHYTGSYNPKVVNIDCKPCWVNIRISKGTIEFRLSPPGFDYPRIMSEIIALSKLVTEMRTTLKFKPYRLERTKSDKKEAKVNTDSLLQYPTTTRVARPGRGRTALFSSF